MVKLAFGLLMPAALLLSACAYVGAFGDLITGSGKPVTREYDLAGFTSVDVGNAFQVQVIQSTSFGVSVTADDNLSGYIKVDREGSSLRIYLDPAYRYDYSTLTLKAKVAMPSLDGLRLSGAVRGNVAGFKSDGSVQIDLSGASVLVGSLDASSVRVVASGASNADLSGSAKDAVLEASGASRLTLANFPLDSAQVNLSGASNANIDVKSRLSYDLSGASSLTYSGNPTIDRAQATGASSATRK